MQGIIVVSIEREIQRKRTIVYKSHASMRIVRTKCSTAEYEIYMRCSNLTHAPDLSNRFWKYEKKIGAIRKKYVIEDRQVRARTARGYTN